MRDVGDPANVQRHEGKHVEVVDRVSTLAPFTRPARVEEVRGAPGDPLGDRPRRPVAFTWMRISRPPISTATSYGQF